LPIFRGADDNARVLSEQMRKPIVTINPLSLLVAVAAIGLAYAFSSPWWLLLLCVDLGGKTYVIW
jgi:fatty acid desaturase